MPSDVSPLERKALEEISDKLRRAGKILGKYDLVAESTDARRWYRFLKSVKDALGNLNNDVSFVATLLAKEYLAREHPGAQFDAAAKSQSAPGLDIDVSTSDGKRIIGEVKTVYPYNETDFGPAQLDSFLQDFGKLSKAKADWKYLFLAEPEAFEVVKKKYRHRIRGIRVVSLMGGDEFTA